MIIISASKLQICGKTQEMIKQIHGVREQPQQLKETKKERCVPVTRLKEDFGFRKGPKKDHEIFSQKYLEVSMKRGSQVF